MLLSTCNLKVNKDKYILIMSNKCDNILLYFILVNEFKGNFYQINFLFLLNMMLYIVLWLKYSNFY